MHAKANRPQFDPDYPAIKAYGVRIGATPKNFRELVVEEETDNGYPRPIATIKIKDGDIVCDKLEFAPTEQELNDIKQEIAKKPLPTSVPAMNMNKLPDEVKKAPKEHLCIFLDASGKKILMIQHRQDGEKPDYPWSFWSDGKWRKMKPDGLYPLYGLEKIGHKKASRVFIHEGAKAARDISNRLKDKNYDHPWLDDLRGATGNAAHLGWPGGASYADGVDWEPIRKLKNDDITIVCDNDPIGKEALTKISSILRMKLTAISFDERFPGSIDLADDKAWFDNKQWWDGKKYKGPKFSDCLISATWATDIIPAAKDSKSKKPSFRILDKFAAEWRWLAKPPLFINLSYPHIHYSPQSFDSCVRPFSDAELTGRLLLRKFSSKIDGLTYDPRELKKEINRDGRRLLNTYRHSKVQPIKGAYDPFIEYMTHLIPDVDDRLKAMRWIATLVARPDIRMSYALLLISETQGVGKSTLGEKILVPLLGDWNVSFPTEDQIVDSHFTGWMSQKRLAFCNEIYAGSSSKAYNKLKSAITDTYVDIEKKYIESGKEDIFISIVALSNSLRALKLENDDRRWLVPRVTENKQTFEYWTEFHNWLRNDGPGIILYWAKIFLEQEHEIDGKIIKGPIQQGEHAPTTSMKKELIKAGRSEGERLAADLAECVLKLKEKKQVILAMEDVRQWVAGQRGLKVDDRTMEKVGTLRKAMVSAGLMEPAIREGSERPRFRIEKARMSYIVANFKIKEGATWDEVKEFYHKEFSDLWIDI